MMVRKRVRWDEYLFVEREERDCDRDVLLRRCSRYFDILESEESGLRRVGIFCDLARPRG